MFMTAEDKDFEIYLVWLKTMACILIFYDNVTKNSDI